MFHSEGELVTHLFTHRVRSAEVDPAPNSEGRPTHYRLEIRDKRIRPTDGLDIYVRGSEGWEPATDFSRRGNGTVFRTIRFEPGRAEIDFSDHANQAVHHPAGMKLKFLVRPTPEQLRL